MLLFGHPYIGSERFYHIDDIDAIDHTPANSMLYLDFSEKNLDIIDHLVTNELVFALGVTSLREVIYASALGAAFIIVHEDIAKSAQDAADSYLFDAKVLCRIETEEQIERLVSEAIDGVLFSEAIIKVTS